MIDTPQSAPDQPICSNGSMAPPRIPSFRTVAIKLRVRRPTSSTSSRASAEDVPLFMGSKSVRKKQRSLSPISDQARKKNSRLSETGDDDPARENLARAMINREILEWQQVCQTGRPSWWSSVSKWTHGGGRTIWQKEFHTITPWHMTLSHDNLARPRFDEQRRAFTDSYLADNNNVQDLAHLIAIQLLSACFTLSPEHLSSHTTSAYHCFDARFSTEMPDSRLISSLRMHTQSRHSPSFGHQARNTSPVYRWQGAFDGSKGSSPSWSPESTSDHQDPDIEVTRRASRKKKLHRAFHASEGFAGDCSMGSRLELYGTPDKLPKATRIAGRGGSKEGIEDSQTVGTSASDRNAKTDPSTISDSDSQVLHSSRLATEIFRGKTPDALEVRGRLGLADLPRRQTVQSIIRSEPHHVYVQPVKELVIKRWRTFRRRLGFGLGDVHHNLASRGANTVYSSSRSTPAEGSVDSPVLSSDGKERRRQARASGDTHRNSEESNPRYNTPTSGTGSEVFSSEHLEHPTPAITLSRDSEVSEAIANVFADSGLTTAITRSFTPPNTATSSNVASPAVLKAEAQNIIKPDSGYFAVHSKPLNSPATSSAHRHGQRRHQRSHLSEIYTPEDVEDPNDLKRPGGGTQLSRPREDPSPGVANKLPHCIPKLDMSEETLPASNTNDDDDDDDFLPEASSSYTSDDETSDSGPGSGKLRRPSLVRTSTSGTQVFTPSRDGVELDGLPTGLPSETWDQQGVGAKGKRKERSFL